MAIVKNMFTAEGDFGYVPSCVTAFRSEGGSLNIKVFGPRTDHGGTVASLSFEDARALADFIRSETTDGEGAK